MSSGNKILIVDDDPGVLRGVGGLLRDEGYRTAEAGNAADAAALLALPRDPPHLMLLDLRMPGETGLELLQRLPKPLAVPVVVLSGEASPADAVAALKLGAVDFVEKPPSPERLLTALRNALALGALAEERERLRAELTKPGTLVGESAAMEELRRVVAKVGPTDSIIMITGETGTGKERVARALHEASGRAGRFVAINCAAIPEQLLESELYGYERGAFSGAHRRYAGRFEQADGGTLLLDEMGDMPFALQSKLLRVLEERHIERLGGTGSVALDVRILASTHRDLRAAVAEGRFRQDLYYRLVVFPIIVPPLRDRPDDIVPLVRAFAADLRGPAGAVTLSAEGVAALRGYSWPGNVRELRNFIERLTLVRGEGPLVVDRGAVALLGGVPGEPARAAAATTSDLPGLGQQTYREIVEDFERRLVRAALEREDGNVAGAARLLHVDRGNLYRRLKALGLTTTDDESA